MSDLFFSAQEMEKAVRYYTKIDCVTENCNAGLLTDRSSWLFVLLCSFNNRLAAVILIMWKTDWKGKEFADWRLVDRPTNLMTDWLSVPACLERVSWQMSLNWYYDENRTGTELL